MSVQGIFEGAKVQRGADWIWEEQDGGPGRTGKVLEIQTWGKNSFRSVANVDWQTTKVRNSIFSELI